MNRFTFLVLPLIALVLVAAGPATTGEMYSASAGTPERIAFGSCLHQDRPQPIWEGIKKFNPELFLLLGDNVYAHPETIAGLKSAYSVQAGILPLVKLINSKALHAIWDDHDYGKNDAGRELSFAKESKQLFLEFFKVPATDPRRQREGLYHEVLRGTPGTRTQILFLDMRSFRDPLRRQPPNGVRRGPYVPHQVPGPTLLGQEQWRWLEERMAQETELRILVSSIVFLSDGHGKESWGNFPAERLRLFELIRSNPAKLTLLLSGDLHRGEVSLIEGLTPYPLYDITSSSLNVSHKAQAEPNPFRVGEVFWGDNFGALEIEWPKRYRPRVRASLRDVQNTVQREILVEAAE